jgi:hypothetical protein
MRQDRKRNQEIVYQAMASFYEETQKWTEDLSTKEVVTRVDVSLRSILREEVREALPKEIAGQVRLADTISGLLILSNHKIIHEFMRKVLISLNQFNVSVRSEGQDKHFLVPWREMDYRVILRHLENLKAEGKIERVKRGRYTIDTAVQKRQSLALEYHKVLSISAAELRGHYASTLLGKEDLVIPFDPAYALPQAASLFKKVYDRRFSRHKDKKIAKAEANIWLNSFMRNVCIEIGSTGAPFRVMSGKMVTSERQEIGPALLGAMIGKRISKRSYGVDALMFQSATDIMFRLLTDLIDPDSLKAFGDSDIVVRISFNPLKFLRTMSNLEEVFEMRLNRQMVRKWGVFPTKTYLEPETKKKRVFSEERSR